jgi:PAS domain S-box-containing protein
MGLVVAVGLWAIRLTSAKLGKATLVQATVADVQALREATFLVVGIGGAVALVVGVVLAIAIGRPIRSLLRRTERMLPTGSRGPVKKIDELSSLSNSLNHLLLSFEKYARISDIFDRLPDAILALSRDGTVQSANAEAQRIFGEPGRELTGTRLADLLEPGRAENDLLLGLLRTTMNTTPTTFDRLALWRRDGVRADVRGSLAVADSDEVSEVILTVQDLARAHTLRDEFRRVDQLAALGALGASIVHEIGGAIQTVQTLVDLITPQIRPETSEFRYVEKIERELDRIRRLADEIRTLAQVELRERVPCQIETLVSEALWTAEMRFQDKGISTVKHVGAVLPPLAGDPERLNRAFLNILTNAFEATPPGGRVSVSVSEEKGPDDLGGGAVIAVRIRNTGSYIGPPDRERIFDLFYTSRKEGSGLGLPVAARAVADHGGRIGVESSREEGTEFTLLLPVEPVGSRV